MRIAIDAMGGDHAPEEIIKGVVMASKEVDCEYILVGDEEKIKKELARYTDKFKYSIIHTTEFIAMDESPTAALRKKRRASVILAAQAVAEQKADALISAGNTGALTEVAFLHLRRLKGIKRPAIATFWPTKKGSAILLDSGANVDCRPEYLLQFAYMGSIYAERVAGITNPRVALLSIGEEPGKGNLVVQKAHAMLKQSKLNYIGNIEIKDFLAGKVDVGVCDGFIGNMILKTGESVAEFIFTFIKEEVSKGMRVKMGAALMSPVFRKLKSKMDYSEHGGAPFLGLNKVCIKSHGRSNAKAIKNAIKAACEAVKQNIAEKISQNIEVYGQIEEDRPQPHRPPHPAHPQHPQQIRPVKKYFHHKKKEPAKSEAAKKE